MSAGSPRSCRRHRWHGRDGYRQACRLGPDAESIPHRCVAIAVDRAVVSSAGPGIMTGSVAPRLARFNLRKNVVFAVLEFVVNLGLVFFSYRLVILQGGLAALGV